MRYGDWNAKNRELYEGGQQYKKSLKKYKVQTPEGEIEVPANSQGHAEIKCYN